MLTRTEASNPSVSMPASMPPIACQAGSRAGLDFGHADSLSGWRRVGKQHRPHTVCGADGNVSSVQHLLRDRQMS